MALTKFVLFIALASCTSSLCAQYGRPQNTPTPKSEPTPDKTKLGVFGKIQVDMKTAEEQVSKRVAPEYPPAAQAAKIQGDVIIHVQIDKKGYVVKVKTMTGDPMLAEPAMAAAKQWQYEPFYSNGKPMEVETNILFKFPPVKN
jgi:TonB family protein